MTILEGESVHQRVNGDLVEVDPSAPEYINPYQVILQTHYIRSTRKGSHRLSYAPVDGSLLCEGSSNKAVPDSILIEDDETTGLCEVCQFYVNIETL